MATRQVHHPPGGTGGSRRSRFRIIPAPVPVAVAPRSRCSPATPAGSLAPARRNQPSPALAGADMSTRPRRRCASRSWRCPNADIGLATGLEGPAIPRPDRANTLRTWRCPPLVHLPGGRMRTPSGNPLWGHDLRVPALPPARLHQHAQRSRWPSDTSRRQAQSASGLGTGNHQPRRRETEVDALAHVRPPRRTARATGDSIHERVGR